MNPNRLNPNYGRGEATLDIDPDDPLGLGKRLRAMVESPGFQPPILPKVAMDLHAMSRRSNVSAQELVRVVETDPTIATLVLRKAQSAFYSGGIQIRSLREAVVRLGFAAVGDLFLEATMSAKVFRAPGFEAPMDRLRLHSAATAHLASMTARYVGVDADSVFLAGLVHDVGAAMAIIAIAGSAPRAALPSMEMLWPAVFEAHEGLGTYLATIWKLPEPVRVAIGDHHAPAAAGENVLVACIAIGEALSAKVGYVAIADPPPPLERAARLLNLAPPQIDGLMKEAERFAATLR